MKLHWPRTNTVRLQLRFLLPLTATLIAAAYLALPVMDRLNLRWFARDLSLRGMLVTNALSDSIIQTLNAHDEVRLLTLLNKTLQDQRLLGLGLCTPSGILLNKVGLFPSTLDCFSAQEMAQNENPQLRIPGGAVHIGVYPIAARAEVSVYLVLLQDLSFIEKRSQDTRQYLMLFIGSLGGVIALITMVVAQISWKGWLAGVRALLRGEGVIRPPAAVNAELASVAQDLQKRLRELEDECRRSLSSDNEWNPQRLRQLLRTQLRGDQVVVVSNREPYSHIQTDTGVVVQRPASGLVTAVEPVMRACSGTWIAHGSGSADRAVVDQHDKILVPPERNEYTLRRLWLTPEEEQNYYYGFSNEGLWPLCHVAHVRPLFRDKDWEVYRQVNQRFAAAVIDEAHREDPIVLVQDYHFALVPALVQAQLPRATIISFWHIPWPNPESFGICPWRREILEGMLGSTILGFHTPFHCQNFIETVDRYLEARIEHENSIISLHDCETMVQSYPISIAWPREEQNKKSSELAVCRNRVLEKLGLTADMKLVLGVDRFDYTKGILERLHTLERLFEKHPMWIGKLAFVQIAAPTRSSLAEYAHFRSQVEQTSLHINERFERPGYKPIHLLIEHHGHEALTELYQAADACLVTSLHDGMNLVCKEFVAARSDNRGVLILSRFAGAARELTQALIVNPYHIEECADALHQALTMPEDEQRLRMTSLRMTVREFNVFRWAARMLTDAATLRRRQRVDARLQHADWV